MLFRSSGEETQAMLRQHPDTAVLLLDVVMETDHAGLEVVRHIRQELKNPFVRIFLRTGQRDKGRAMLKAVAGRLRAAPGPDNWAQTLFTLESMARAAREAEDWDLASWAAEQMFEHDAGYAGTHYALALVAEHNRQADRARTAFEQAVELWRQADPGLPELGDARKRVGR